MKQDFKFDSSCTVDLAGTAGVPCMKDVIKSGQYPGQTIQEGSKRRHKKRSTVSKGPIKKKYWSNPGSGIPVNPWPRQKEGMVLVLSRVLASRSDLHSGTIGRQDKPVMVLFDLCFVCGPLSGSDKSCTNKANGGRSQREVLTSRERIHGGNPGKSGGAERKKKQK